VGRYPVLELPSGKLGPFAKSRRLAAISEAISWPKGATQSNQVATCVFSYNDASGDRWEVLLAKPGKEAFQPKRTNPNDMFPIIRRSGVDIPYGEAFAGIWNEIEKISTRPGGSFACELLSRFVVACAFMVAHEETAVGSGVWRVSAGTSMQRVYGDIEFQVPMTTYIQGNIPLRVFLNLIEAIALQEDVKYYTLNGYQLKGNQGRINNLLTTAGVIRYLGGLEPVSWLVGGLSRPPSGVLSLSQGDLRKLFPPIP